MHAVVVRVSISDAETAQKGLVEVVVPRVSQSPGFVAGYWTRSDDGSNGQSMLVLESEDAARTVKERIGNDIPEGVGVVPIPCPEAARAATLRNMVDSAMLAESDPAPAGTALLPAGHHLARAPMKSTMPCGMGPPAFVPRVTAAVSHSAGHLTRKAAPRLKTVA